MNQRKVTSSVAPDLFTVEEAARVLRIGRTTAYELARRYLRSNGAEGSRCCGLVTCCACRAADWRSSWVVRTRGRSLTNSSPSQHQLRSLRSTHGATRLVDAARLRLSSLCPCRRRTSRCQLPELSFHTSRCLTDRWPPAAGVESGSRDVAGVDVVCGLATVKGRRASDRCGGDLDGIRARLPTARPGCGCAHRSCGRSSGCRT
jgi:hypothetical protein